MNHYFSVETACTYGVTEAVLLNHFAYWIARNQKAGTNFRDGRFWTFHTRKELCDAFPYLTESAIRRALKHLREEGVLLAAHYNAKPYDRTLWYALADPDQFIGLLPPMNGNSDANQLVQQDQPIPDNTTDNTPNDTPDRERKRARWQPPEKEAIKAYCLQQGSGIDPEAFYDYYAARGWMYGPGKPMRDWKAAVRSWERREKEHPEKAAPRSAEEIYADIFAGRI